MSILRTFLRFSLFILAVVCIIPCASAWTFGSWSGAGPQDLLQPGSPVTAHYTLSFSSYDTGTTFEADNSLIMYTDLADPLWVVTMTETADDVTPLTTQLLSRKAVQIRLDGWSLSFSRKQFAVNVRLDGKVPNLSQSQEITLVRVQEMDPEAKLVSGTQIKKVAQVSVPTPEPTTEPIVQAQETVLEITPEPVTTVTTIKPTKKQTYSPGPDPLLVCGMLAGLVMVLGLARHRE